MGTAALAAPSELARRNPPLPKGVTPRVPSSYNALVIVMSTASHAAQPFQLVSGQFASARVPAALPVLSKPGWPKPGLSKPGLPKNVMSKALSCQPAFAPASQPLR